MFQSKFQEFLLEKINLNTQELLFSGDYIYSYDNGKFTVTTQIEGTYRTEDTEYIPAQVIEWNNTQQPYKDIDLQDLSVPFRIATREEQLEDTLNAIEEFRTLLNGNEFEIDGYNVGFRVGQPAPPVSPQQDSGNTWVIVDIFINASASKNTIVGNTPINNFKMAKTGETLQEIVASSINITVTTNTNPNNVQGEYEINVNSRTLQFELTIFYKDNVALTNDLLDYLWADLDFTQKFDIEIKYSDTITKTEIVTITTMQQSLQHGVPVGFVITMFR